MYPGLSEQIPGQLIPGFLGIAVCHLSWFEDDLVENTWNFGSNISSVNFSLFTVVADMVYNSVMTLVDMFLRDCISCCIRKIIIM